MSGGSALRRALLVTALALAADQVTKAIARSSIEPGERVEFVPGVDFVRVGNEGIAFGMLEGVSSGLLVAIAVVFTLGLGWFLFTASDERPALWLPIGLLAGGAIGNLIDRLREGAVTDFIDLPSWPSFNVADVEITVGVVLLTWVLLREPDPEPASQPAPDPGADPGEPENGGRAESGTPAGSR